MTPIEFEVLGLPAPQGSKTRMPNGAMVEAGSASGRLRHKDWRTAVADAAREVAEHDDVAAPLDGPLGLSVEFRFPMAQSRPKAVRALGRAWKVSKPDTDKLLRSVGDALTVGGLIVDDARFVAVEAVKVEVTGWTGAIIRITREDGAA